MIAQTVQALQYAFNVILVSPLILPISVRNVQLIVYNVQALPYALCVLLGFKLARVFAIIVMG